MSIRNIVIEPDPILRKKSSKLETVDDEYEKTLRRHACRQCMNAPGIGLGCGSDWYFEETNSC